MNNTEFQESLMFKVMTAIYESKIPVSFKGSMVLKAFLQEMGYAERIRPTRDIDGNWNSDIPSTTEQMVDSLQRVLNENNIDLKVSLFRMYKEGRSAGFQFVDYSDEQPVFSMDVDVNRPVPELKIYEMADIRFSGVTPTQMIADKLSAISGDKVFRRIKDILDLYYISNVFKFEVSEVLRILKKDGRVLRDFSGFLNRIDDLKHAYERYRIIDGEVKKPSFEEVYQRVKSYIKDILPEDSLR